jgi:hypothetical protein
VNDLREFWLQLSPEQRAALFGDAGPEASGAPGMHDHIWPDEPSRDRITVRLGFLGYTAVWRGKRYRSLLIIPGIYRRSVVRHAAGEAA